jgi:tetratricopeptide (TPR) repeat protein
MVAPGCTRLPASAVRQIGEAHRAYQAGRYAQAQRLVTPVIAKHGDKPDVAEALYVRGLSRLKTGQTVTARADFESALGVADRDELIALLHAQLGNLDYEAGQYQGAIAHFRDAQRLGLPSRPPSDRVLARYADSLQRVGRFREAKTVHARLLVRFPHGQAATQVRQQGTWAKDYYTIQCGVYSKPESARRAAADLGEKGLDASAWREDRNGAVRHVVRTGRYRTHAEATRALAAVRRVVPDAFIVP